MRITVIHFNPLEMYPPVMNFIEDIEEGVDTNCKVSIFSLSPGPRIRKFNSTNEKISIHRPARFALSLNIGFRIWNYLVFYLSVLWHLVWKRPARILYYETISSLPAFLYKKILNRKAEIYVHYHEYTSSEEYHSGMLLNRWFHALELKLYTELNWLSHTNQDRMHLFLKDIAPIRPPVCEVMANYPPAKWQRVRVEKLPNESGKIRIVYLGAIDLENMYIREFLAYVESNKDNVVWDIYSMQDPYSLIELIKSLSINNVFFRGALNYDEVPSILNNYDVGVILYKPHILNFKFNAPNKLFEYLSMGLDVWFPDNLTGALPYAKEAADQKILALDFTRLESYPLPSLVSNGTGPAANQFSSAVENAKLIKALSNPFPSSN